MRFSLPSINQLTFGGSFELPTSVKRGNQIVEHSSDQATKKTVNGTSQKLGGAAKHLIDSRKTYLLVEL